MTPPRATKWTIVGLIAQTAAAVFFGWIAYLAWQALP